METTKDLKPIQGKKRILLFRLLKDASKAKAAKLAFQTEHEVSKTRDSETTETKDGAISTGQGLEEEITFSCIIADGDPTYDMLNQAMDENEILEIWEVNTSEEQDGQYPGKYRQGIMTELTETANAEDLMEFEGTYKTNGLAQPGLITLSQEQKEVVQYAFRDTTEHTGADEATE